MADYIVESRSRVGLRALADTLRKNLGLENELRMPVIELLDVLAEVLDNFSYEIVWDDELSEGVHAETNVQTGHIKIKESVYEGACRGNGRDRMTIAHEIGHYFTLCFCGFKLRRNFNHAEVRPYNDPEWQAKCFAGEFMIPHRLAKGMSAERVAEICGVSFDAAKYQQKYCL